MESPKKTKAALISPDGLLTYFTHIFANSKDMINLFSLTNGEIILWNEAATASMGYTMEDFEKIPLEKRYPPKEFAKLGVVLQTLAKEDYAFEKVKMYSKAGELKDLWMRAFVIQREPEAICLVHTIDVTEEKKREDKAIREAKLATLGEASAVLSHELSNPLQLIEFNLSLIESSEKELSEESRLKIQKIKTSIARMSEIITSVMKYARNSKAHTTTYTSLAATTEDAVAILRGYFEKKAISIELKIPTDLPLLKADSGQVQQILLIILKNAAQALIDQPVRKIVLTAKRLEHKIELIISDTGPGIPEDVQRNIFDAFSTTKPVGIGLGLGLSIAKRLAIANAIDIRFRSMPNQGAEFMLDFILEDHILPASLHSSKFPGLEGITALVVDDNTNSLMETTKHLQKLKVKVLTATSAREGLKLLSIQKLDCIFCGENMYPISGTLFAREARRSFTGLICITGPTGADTDKLNQTADLNLSFLKTPFNLADIENLIKGMVNK